MNKGANRWGILGVVCMDCGLEQKTHPRPLGVSEGERNDRPNSHILVINLPLRCPRCHNLKLVSSTGDAS